MLIATKESKNRFDFQSLEEIGRFTFQRSNGIGFCLRSSIENLIELKVSLSPYVFNRRTKTLSDNSRTA